MEDKKLTTWTNKNTVRKDGINFVTAYISSTGMADTTMDSATVTVTKALDGVVATYLDAQTLTQGDNGIWSYLWIPARTPRLDPGEYIVQYIFTKGSDTYQLFDDIVIEANENENNRTWFSAPQSGQLTKHSTPSSNWP